MVFYIGLTAIVFLYVLFVVPTQWLKIERNRCNIGLNRKILQISDLHVEKTRISPEILSKVIQAEKPDYICLTGDFAQQNKSMNHVESYFNMIAKTAIPTYAVLGNHDHQMENIEELVEKMKAYRITLLRNESVQLRGFQLVGIDDDYSGHSDEEKAYRDVDPKLPIIVITHDPDIVLDMNRSYDYLMAGHLHGKQINLPFLFTFRPMGRLPAMGIYKGHHQGEKGPFYISKGVGQTKINARLFVRSEVTIHYV